MQNIVIQSIPFLFIVEDSDEDFESFMRITKQLCLNYPVFRCRDGDEALDWLQRIDDNSKEKKVLRPSVILLDLNLPGTDGRQVLEHLKNNPQLKQIPTVIFTSSANPKDIEFCYQKGAESYIVKPIDISKLKTTVQTFWDYWFQVVTLPLKYEV